MAAVLIKEPLLQRLLQEEFYRILYLPVTQNQGEYFQSLFALCYDRLPIRIVAASTWYRYNKETKQPLMLPAHAAVVNTEIFGRDLTEAKLILSVRAEAFLQTWAPQHQITPQILRIFKAMKVPMPETVINPALEKGFNHISSMEALQEAADNFYSRLATTHITWLFLRQVYFYLLSKEPDHLHPATTLEPSYAIQYEDGIPIGVRMQNGYPCYSWINNETNYISIRSAFSKFMPHASPFVVNQWITGCSKSELEEHTKVEEPIILERKKNLGLKTPKVPPSTPESKIQAALEGDLTDTEEEETSDMDQEVDDCGRIKREGTAEEDDWERNFPH